MAWLPLLAVGLAAWGTIYTKRFLTGSRIAERDFLSITAAGSAVLAIALAFFTGQFADWKIVDIFGPSLVWAYLLYIAVAVLGLWFYLGGFRREKLVRVELSEFIDEIAIISAVGIAFPVERDARVYIATAIALLAYAFGHFSRKHLSLQFGERLLLIASLFYAVEAVLERLLLVSFTPLELLVLREVGLALAFLLAFGLPSHEGIRSHRFWGALGAVLIWFAYHVCLFTAYAQVGVTATVLALLVLPVVLAIWGWLVEGDRVPARLGIAGLVIFGAVAYALSVVR